jgi:hypothetical protein
MWLATSEKLSSPQPTMSDEFLVTCLRSLRFHFIIQLSLLCKWNTPCARWNERVERATPSLRMMKLSEVIKSTLSLKNVTMRFMKFNEHKSPSHKREKRSEASGRGWMLMDWFRIVKSRKSGAKLLLLPLEDSKMNSIVKIFIFMFYLLNMMQYFIFNKCFMYEKRRAKRVVGFGIDFLALCAGLSLLALLRLPR